MNIKVSELLNADLDSSPPLSKLRSKVYSSKRGKKNVNLSGFCLRLDRERLILAILIALFRYGYEKPIICIEKEENFKSRYGLKHIDFNKTDLSNYSFEIELNSIDELYYFSFDEIFQLAQDYHNDSFKYCNPIFLIAFSYGNNYEQLLKLKTDIIISLQESENLIEINYNSRLYKESVIERFAQHILEQLRKIVSFEDSNIVDYAITTENENSLIESFENGNKDEYAFRPINELLSITENPNLNSTIIIDHGERYSFEEIDKRSNIIANYLLDKQIKQNDVVGICLRPGKEQIFSLLALFKAGVTVLPIDYSLPISRIEYILKSCKPKVIITDKTLCIPFDEVDFEELEISKIYNLDQLFNDSDTGIRISRDDLAYILFTSGSSGKPKGVCMPHKSLSNLIEWQLKRSINSRKKTLQRTSIAFDVGFQEILTTIIGGGTLFIADDDERADILCLPLLIESNNIERLFLPPVALKQLAQIFNPRQHNLKCLNEIIVAGEQLKIDQSIIRLFHESNISLDNQYGPTETHVVSAFRLGESPLRWPKLPPIGEPIQYSRIQVLDKFGNRVPIGVNGEIYISGIPVASGYLKQTDNNQNPFSESNLFENISNINSYKTGDLAYWDEDGKLNYVGRNDEQIKIKGYRVELGEVEVALQSIPSVNSAVCSTYKDKYNENQIVAYVTPQILSPKELRACLVRILPSYMIPATNYIIPLDTFPITKSGKVDKNKLPEQISSNDQDSIESEDSLAITVATVISKELGLKKINLEDKFIELGGDSLSAIQVILGIEKVFGIGLPLSSVLRGTSSSVISEISAIKTSKTAGVNEQSTSVAFNSNFDKKMFRLKNGQEIVNLYPPETEYLYADIFEHLTYEQSGISYPDEGVIIDIGANIGLFTIFARMRSPLAHIVAIEPLPSAFNALFSNVANIEGLVTPLNIAISDNSGEADITYYPLVSGMSSLHPNIDEERNLFSAILHETKKRHSSSQNYEYISELLNMNFESEIFSVKTKTLSEVIRNLNLSKIDLLKIDAQKSEIDILKGIDEKSWKMINQIIIEAHDCGDSFASIKLLLTYHGFGYSIKNHPMHKTSNVKMIYAIKNNNN